MKLTVHKNNIVRRIRDRHAAKSPATPACQAVLDTAELLEAILLLLDSRDVLVSAQRVCRTWRGLIVDSFRLQEVLFLRDPCPSAYSSPRPSLDLSPSTSVSSSAFSLSTPRHIHPLLQSAFGPLFHEGLDATATYISRLEREQRPHYWMFGMEGMQAMRLPIADAAGRRRSRHRAFTCRGASWRRMHVAQPPIFRVGFIRQNGDEAASGNHSKRPAMSAAAAPGADVGSQQQQHRILHFRKGLRMGELYDLLDGIVWGDGSEARGKHYAWVSWDPARTLDSLAAHRQMLAVQRVIGEWVAPGRSGDEDVWEDDVQQSKVDIVVGEEATRSFSTNKVDFYNVLVDSDDKIEYSAWMFRCKEFKDPAAHIGEGA